MNAGLPLVDPTGGFYYVFITGTPLVRKYDSQGTLLFERHVEGRELDDYLDVAAKTLAATTGAGQRGSIRHPGHPQPPPSATRRAVDLLQRAVHLRLRPGRRQDPHGAVPGRGISSVLPACRSPRTAACSSPLAATSSLPTEAEKRERQLSATGGSRSSVMPTAALTAQHLTRRFGDRVAVDDVSFELPTGEIFALLGPQRRREDDDAAHAGGAHRADLGLRADRRRQRSRPARRPGCAGASAFSRRRRGCGTTSRCTRTSASTRGSTAWPTRTRRSAMPWLFSASPTGAATEPHDSRRD